LVIISVTWTMMLYTQRLLQAGFLMLADLFNISHEKSFKRNINLQVAS
jgi:hypothetical protein